MSKRILSFDVGTKDLAYCVLVETPEARAAVERPLVLGQPPAGTVPLKEGGGRKRKRKVPLPEEQDGQAPDEGDVQKFARIAIEHWECVDVFADAGRSNVNANKISAETAVKHVVLALHKRGAAFTEGPLDAVLVEKQFLKNGASRFGARGSQKNKAVAHAIQAVIQKMSLEGTLKTSRGKPTPVYIVSAKHKLTVHEGSDEAPGSTLGTADAVPEAPAGPAGGVKKRTPKSPKKSAPQKYKENKDTAVLKTRRILGTVHDGAHWKARLDATLKCDDLADAFLQGIYWLQK